MNLNVQINRIYQPLLTNQSYYLLVYGGGGSGKSHFVAQKLILRMLTEPGHKILILRKVKETLQVSVYALFEQLIQEMGLSAYFKFQKSAPKSIVCKNGSSCIFLGIDDPEKLKSIAGITSIWIEEATEITQEDFTQTDLRLRGETKFYKQIILSFNPINQNHWIYNYFFVTQAEYIRNNTTICKSTYLDNALIDAQYKRKLEAYKFTDPERYRVYCLGEWGKLENQIYPTFQLADSLPAQYDEVYYGLDFGFNNPTALLRIGVADANYYVSELVYESGLTNEKLISRLAKNQVGKRENIYCDSAAPQSIQEICNAGYNALPSDKSVKDGINTVRELHPRIFSHYRNRHLNAEVLGYQYKKTKDGEILEEPVKYEDHALDALRYALHTHNKKRKPEQRITVW